MAWLTGWDHRKSVTLSRASGAVTDYQIRFVVGEGSGGDVDCEGGCLSTFNDLRFTTSDGTTLLDYYIEYITGSTPNQLATVVVEFDSIGTGATTFYVYYGKADATAVSSIGNTFIFGDNLEQDTVGNDPSLWTISQGTLSLLKVQADALARIEKTVCSLNAASVRVASNGTVWAGHQTDGTVRKSTDGGVTWTTKYTFAVGTGFVRGLWIAANGYIFASVDGGDILVRSTDGGENWSTCKTLSGSSNSGIWHMAQDSGGNIYAGEYSTGDGSEKCAYIYKSTDNGANWSTIWNNPDNVRHIHIVAVDSYTDKLYASQDDSGGSFTNSKLIRSDNGGTSWTTLGSGAASWMPTSVAFGSGYRLFGNDGLSGTPATIKKTTNDTDFTDSYTAPSTDDEVFWNGGEKNEDGLIVFSSWTQKDNERATIVGTKDDGTTWRVFDFEATGVGNRGYLSVSNISPDGFFYITRSVEANIIRCVLEISTDKKIKASSADTTQATGYKAVSFPNNFVVEVLSSVDRTSSVLAVFHLRQDTTERINIIFWSDALIKYHNGTDWISTGITYIPNRHYRIKCIVNLSGGIWDLYIDNVSIATSIPFRTAGSTANRLDILSGAIQQGNNYYDSFTVGNYASPEPAWGSWSAEENAPVIYSYSAQAGCLVGGLSSLVFIKNLLTSGGFVTGGLSGWSRSIALSATGGVIIGGIAVRTNGFTCIADGGSVIAGEAELLRLLHILANGGVVTGGNSTVLKLNQFLSGGGGVIGGSARIWVAVVLGGNIFLFPQDLISDIKPSSNLTKNIKAEFIGEFINDFDHLPYSLHIVTLGLGDGPLGDDPLGEGETIEPDMSHKDLYFYNLD